MGWIWTRFLKMSHMVRPGPANTFVILDESPVSINDEFFAPSMEGYDPRTPGSFRFADVPATYHNMAGSFSFADGTPNFTNGAMRGLPMPAWGWFS